MDELWMNATLVEQGQKPPEIAVFLVSVAYLCALALGLNNIRLIMSLVEHKLFKNFTNVYVLCLGIADTALLFSSICLLALVWNRSWVFSNGACRLYWVVEQSSKYASVMFTATLCFDRYLTVCAASQFPQHRTGKITAIAVGSCLLASALIAMPVYNHAEIVFTNGHSMCVILWPENGLEAKGLSTEIQFAIYAFTFTYLVPITAIVACCVLVWGRLRFLFRKRRTDFSELRRNIDALGYTGTTWVVLIIGLTHLVCHTPLWILNICSILNLTGELSLGKQLSFNVVHYLPYLNSAMNPYLYGALKPKLGNCSPKCCPAFSVFGRRKDCKIKADDDDKESSIETLVCETEFAQKSSQLMCNIAGQVSTSLLIEPEKND